MKTDASKNYTPEVEAALAARRQEQALPPPPPVPDGHVQYHVAVHDTLVSGVAPPKAVAATLRALADQLDPLKPAMRST